MKNRIENKKITTGFMEEWLLTEMPEITISRGEATVIAGIDCGSTQTRAVLHGAEIGDVEKDIKEIFVMPSGYGLVPYGREVRANSELMYDNLNSVIFNLDDEIADMVDTVNIVRTSMAANLGVNKLVLSSTKDKSEDPSLILNLLDTIGYGLIKKFNGKLVDKYNLYVTIALPPEELTDRNIKKLKDNLRTYSWGTGGTSITLNFEHIEFIPEAEAYIQAVYAFSEDIPTYSLHIEGGGRSISPALCKEGRPIHTARTSFPYGGSQLKDNIIRRYYEQEGVTATEIQVESALETGELKIGSKYFDIKQIIKEEKEKYGKKIASDILKGVFDRVADISPAMIEQISVSGRLFSEGEIGVSIFEYLETALREIAPHAEYYSLDDQLVCIGAILYEFGQVQ